MSNRPFKERKADYLRIMETARNLGVQHPELFAAQWALESDWGEKVIGKNNYWGVKAGNGDPNNNSPGTVGWTHENINGKKIRVKQKFRDYETLDEAIKDRYAFTSKKGGRYDKAGYFKATSPAEAAMALQNANYATDPNYANSLIDVMRGIGVDPYNGQKYDFSTTKPQPIAQTAPSPLDLTALAQQFTPPTQNQGEPTQPEPLTTFTEQFNALNDTLADYTEPQVQKPNYRKQYQNQLAAAFGVTPEMQGGLPDYIGDLVRSIYDQTA